MGSLRWKIRQWIPTGLAAKLIKAVIIIFAAIGLVFFLISVGQVHVLERIVETEGDAMTTQAELMSKESMDKLTRESLQEISFMAADKTDDELWVNGYELSILGAMVQEVFMHPENYGRVTVEPPRMENAGELTLQLLAPNGYENISPETMETMERLANLAPIMKTYIGEYTIDCYIATPDGTTLAMDRMSDGKFDEAGNIKAYDASTRPWYKGALQEQDLYFGPAVQSFFYDYSVVIYSKPIYVEDELVAVLEGTLRIDSLQERVNQRLLGETGFNVLISKDGQLVSTTREEGELAMREELSEDIRGSVNDSLVELINTGLNGDTTTGIVEIDGEKYYAGCGPLVTVGWTQLCFVSVQEVMEPTAQLLGQLTESNARMERDINHAFNWTIATVFILMGIIVIGTILIVSHFARKRVAPINHMTTRIKEISGENMRFEMEDIYKTGDEIETLARAFEGQSAKLGEYMEENIRISAEKERIESEMSMATQIQESMLPKVRPMFFGKPEYQLFARTVPAKDVGGDFYDFFYVDEDHLAMVMADVSGKGITAALFMALSKQMIQSQMMMSDGDVVEALEVANRRLLEESVPDMFVTVWLGVINLSTGHLVFVDAGHEYPAIQSGDGRFVIEKDIHSMAVAALKKAKFKINEMELKPGDTIYLYTDGVTEAHNVEGAMFGMERLADALNEVIGQSVEDIDAHVRHCVEEFAQGEEQFDDITTLCFRYQGKQQ